jgi:hypothetical protein
MEDNELTSWLLRLVIPPRESDFPGRPAMAMPTFDVWWAC